MAERMALHDESDLDRLMTMDPNTEVEVDATEPDEPEADAVDEATEVEEIDESEVRGLRQKAQMVDRFYSDPAYALQTIQQVAQTMGYTVAKAGAAPGAPERSREAVPAWVEEAARQALAGEEDIAFLAPAIAKVAHAITQQQLGPIHERAQAQEVAQRQVEFERMAQDLEAEGVDWRQHEDEMMERLTFLRQAVNGGSLSHPRYGNILKMLHQWTTGERGAQVEAGKRMQRALTNRSTTGSTRAQPPVDVTQLIREKTSPQDQWAIAAKHALAEVRAGLRGR